MVSPSCSPRSDRSGETVTCLCQMCDESVTLVAAHALDANPDRHRVIAGELLGCPVVALETPSVLVHVGRQLVGRRIVGDKRLARRDDDVAAETVAVEMQAHARIALDRAELR